MALHQLWPKSPIYTAFKTGGSTAAKEFAKAEVRESFLAPLIKHKNLYSPLRFFAPLIWRSFNLEDFDLVITSSSWYITRGFRTGKKTKIVCYCHNHRAIFTVIRPRLNGSVICRSRSMPLLSIIFCDRLIIEVLNKLIISSSILKMFRIG